MKSLVLLHGWGVDASVFDDLRRHLIDRFDVQAPALPGYAGRVTCQPYDLDHLAAALAATAPERCFVAGWSLGGQIALTWAQRAPHQVERIALIGTTPCFAQRESWKSAIEERVLRDFAQTLEADAGRTLKRFCVLQAHGDSGAREVAVALRGALASTTQTDIHALRGGLQILLESDLRAGLAAIEHDALVIHGKNDSLVPIAAAQYLASALPNAALSVVCGAAHAPFVSRVEVVAHALCEFLS